MVTHKPWVGDDYYTPGLKGQKIAIVGHSHWYDEYGDCDEKTCKVVSKVISGAYRIRFFTSIKNYFGYEEHADFWPRVLFFNYLPECIGSGEARYSSGLPKLITRAQDRFLGLMRKHKPQKVIVFSNAAKKGWQTFPPTSEESASPGGECARLGEQYPWEFTWGTYEVEGHTIRAFGLRHPQGANAKMMRDAVQEILART